MSVTLRDVARRAGVSNSAVSRTFTDGASVSEPMRRRVEKAARELGYLPNALAASLTTGRTRLIGLVSNNFHNPVFLQVFDLFTRGLQERGLRALIVNLSAEESPGKSVQLLRQYSVDGVVIASSTLSPDFAVACRSVNLPVVHCFGRSTASPEIHVVGIDNVEAGRLAAHELLARGYRRIGFLGGPESATTTQDRLQGFLEILKRKRGIRVSCSFADAYAFDAGRREMQRLLQSTPEEAWFCGDDVLSIGAMSAIADASLRVPEDIGILGLNDMAMAGWANINLTTIHQPIPQIIQSSIELMVAMLAEPGRYPEARLFPCRLTERGTLRPRL